jgi:hypothetical protein
MAIERRYTGKTLHPFVVTCSHCNKTFESQSKSHVRAQKSGQNTFCSKICSWRFHNAKKKKNLPPAWTPEMISFLRENYSTRGAKFCAEVIGKKPGATHAMASKLGLTVSPDALSLIFRSRPPLPKQSSLQIEARAAFHRGRKRSPETCARISAALRGKKRGPRSEEYRANLSRALKGRKHSAEARMNMSLARRGKGLGRKMTPEHREKLRRIMTGREVSEETRERMRLANKGKSIPPEVRIKISLAGIGRTATNETRAKRSRTLRDLHRKKASRELRSLEVSLSHLATENE